MSLPNTYLPLSYIESTGTQWIETNLYARASDIITYTGNFTTIEKGQMMIGCHNSGRYRKIGVALQNEVAKFIAPCGYWNESVTGGIAHVGYPVANADTNKHTFVYNYTRNSLTIDGNEYAMYNGLNDASANRAAPGANAERHNTMVIFAYRHDSEFDVGTKASFRLYDCTFSQGGAIVRNYVPALRKSDRKPGLYDLVNDVFYTNSNTTGDDFKYELDSYKTIVYGQTPITSYTTIINNNTSYDSKIYL